jgi:hypothetical protein
MVISIPATTTNIISNTITIFKFIFKHQSASLNNIIIIIMAGSAQHSSSSTNVYNEDDKSPGLTAAWTPFCNDKRPVTFKPLTDDKLTAQVLPLSMKCPICDHIFEDYAEYKDHENDC